MSPISVCILINEWHPRLPQTLASYGACCSEMLLGVNGGFNPEAYPELKQARLRLVSLGWSGYGATRNKLAGYARHEWILSVDTDEVADPALQEALSTLSPSDPGCIYTLSMCHHLGAKPIRHGSWAAGKRQFPRLYNRSHTQWDEAVVHERILIPPHTQLVPLPGKILHYTALDYQQLIAKSKQYAVLSARKYRQAGKQSFPGRSWLSAAFSFVRDYCFRLGFLDGKAGWQIAKSTALYTYWKYRFLRRPERDE